MGAILTPSFTGVYQLNADKNCKFQILGQPPLGKLWLSDKISSTAIGRIVSTFLFTPHSNFLASFHCLATKDYQSESLHWMTHGQTH